MNIVIIGTGNTATVLGRKLRLAGHRIVQVYGRSNKAASELAYELGTNSTNYWNVVDRTADIYLIAVPDIAVADVFRELALPQKTVVHTAASVSKEVLHQGSNHFGVFYPLQSLKKSVAHLPATPIIIDASDPQTLEKLEAMALSISDTVVEAGDETRARLHLAAVVVNNFTNHLYALVESYCQAEGLDFTLLLPLIQETGLRLKELSPAHAQTGPALRHDTATTEKHLAMLAAYPELKNIYQLFTQSIQLHS